MLLVDLPDYRFLIETSRSEHCRVLWIEVHAVHRLLKSITIALQHIFGGKRTPSHAYIVLVLVR